MNASNNQAVATTTPAPFTPQRPKVVVVAGPTAVGKTALSIRLAKRFQGEIVNADSRYLYQGFNIGVDKPSLEEREEIPHHLVDILPPWGEMSLARYQDLAVRSIVDVAQRGKLPILTGGTPLYINAVVEGWKIPRVAPDPEFRQQCETTIASDGGASLLQRLREVDPTSADRCGPNLRRVIRALEVFEATGIPMSAQEGKGPPPFETLEIGLIRPREELHTSIDRRVEAQIARGLVDEVEALLAAGVPPHASAMSSIGYRQLLPYLAGESSLESAVTRIKADTHRYVRHQETWLRKNPRLVRIDVSQDRWQQRVEALVDTFLRRPPHE